MTDSLALVEYRFECGEFPWRVREVWLHERLDAPFESELCLFVTGPLTNEDVLGKPATLTLVRGETERSFRGEIVQAELLMLVDGQVEARVRFEPRMVRTLAARRSRIFQDLSVPEIVRRVVGEVLDLGFASQLDREPPPRDYCVQYDETDLEFITRILEDEGISWCLDDRGEQQVVRLADGPRAFLPIDGDPDLRIIPERYDLIDEESVQSIRAKKRCATRGVVERDWQWLSSSAEVHELSFPADATEPRTAVSMPRRWAVDSMAVSVRREYERRAAGDLVFTGTTNVIALAAGGVARVDLGGDGRAALLVSDVVHRCDDPSVALAGAAMGPNYTNEFAAQPADTPYRPAHDVLRPRIHGVHTAVVTGPENEEIFTDEHGRIRVRMHWDRSDSPPESSTCWLRVAQTWAGAGWGSMVIPRVGMEVLVAFLDGDPDRPMCIGCVYNGTNTPPYPLPDEKTKTTLRSNSSPGGDGFNELTFEDRKDAEQVFLHAQRDLVEKVKRNETMSIGSDRGISVGRNDTLSVGGDQKVTVDGNQTLTVSGGGKQGTKGAEVAIKGLCKVAVTDPGEVEIYAGSKITLQCGASKIVIDKTSIKVFAGSGAYTNLDTAIFSQSSNGASTKLEAAVTVKSMHGSAFVIDGKVSSTSADGASVVLDKEVTAKAVAGAQLTLNADAALGGGKASVESAQGSWLVLDTNADLGGAVKTTCSGPGGQLEVAATGVTIDGSQVEINGAAKVAMLAPLVSAN